jgi:hypothetical protein
MSANRARGEVPLIIGGQSYSLCLTLGALAQIEALFDGDEVLGERLKRLNARDLLDVLAILLRGGSCELSADDLRNSPLKLDAAAKAVADCFEAAL